MYALLGRWSESKNPQNDTAIQYSVACKNHTRLSSTGADYTDIFVIKVRNQGLHEARER